MKRVIAILLAIVYFSFSTGVTLHQHYCMGKMTGVTLWHESGDTHHCARCGMLKKHEGNGCCGDLHVLLKADQNYVAAQNFFSPSPFPAASLPQQPAFGEQAWFGASALRDLPKPHAPPDLASSCPRFIRNCSFLI